MDVVTLGAALNGAKKYTDTKVSSLMGGVKYKGSVNYYNDLPSDANEGDAYTVKYTGTSGSESDGTEYVWGLDSDTGSLTWISFASNGYTKQEISNLLTPLENTEEWVFTLEDGSTLTKNVRVAE